MFFPALHHIELCVANGKKMVSYFTNKLGFSLQAWRDTQQSLQWVLGSQKSTFVVTQRKHSNVADFIPFNSFCCQSKHKHDVDSVFNVALEVKDVENTTKKMTSLGGHLIQPVSEIKDHFGTVQYSIVGACCGNIVHTLLDKSQYAGPFLPTFNQHNGNLSVSNHVSHVDHVTYVCHPGQSVEIVEWYSKCLGMKKFITNRMEDPAEGLVIGGSVGMRLRVMDYWRCAESGICSPDSDLNNGSSLKIVLAESLPDQENSHIGAFLNGHGGPGLQHIGLHTTDIVGCVDRMITNGVQFRKAPPAYYEQEGKKMEISKAGYDLGKFQQLGLLLDSEADIRKLDGSGDDCYLLQIFTLPLFNEETFFFEVIQRKGARGFGAGNVTALARSIEEEKKLSSMLSNS